MGWNTRLTALALAVFLFGAGGALAQAPPADDATRYAALGDSIPAGFKAQPATQGYPYLLYQNGAFDRLAHTLFNNLAVVGANSQDVLDHQVPLVLIPGSRGGFTPDYITLTVGGNDLASIQRFAAVNPDPFAIAQFAQATVAKYADNLGAILLALTTELPNVKIFVGNQYTVPEIEELLPAGAAVLAAFNQALEIAVLPFAEQVHVVDVYSAFLDREGLLLIDRHGASTFEVHLTNAGQRAMAQAFADEIALHK